MGTLISDYREDSYEYGDGSHEQATPQQHGNRSEQGRHRESTYPRSIAGGPGSFAAFALGAYQQAYPQCNAQAPKRGSVEVDRGGQDKFGLGFGV
jgi:hypothetical protein